MHQNRPNMIPADRHASLPPHLNAAELEEYLEKNSVDTFTHEMKEIFSEDELNELAKESSAKGREINRLLDMLKAITKHVQKGSEEATTFSLPATVGTKLLDTHRRENDDFLETGYSKNDVRIFGIPNINTHFMEYFTADGQEVKERRRTLSASEKQKFAGFFGNLVDRQGKILDEVTGEVLGDGTNDN